MLQLFPCFIVALLAILLMALGCNNVVDMKSHTKATKVREPIRNIVRLEYLVEGGLRGGIHEHFILSTKAKNGNEVYITIKQANEIIDLLRDSDYFQWESNTQGVFADLKKRVLSVKSNSLAHSVIMYEIPKGKNKEAIKKLLSLVNKIYDIKAEAKGGVD